MERNRIFGVETEFGSAAWDDRRKEFSQSDYSLNFMDFAVGGQNQYLPNGARVYLDAGSHVETATPECVSARQVVVYEKALEKMIAAKAAEFNNHLPGKAKIILFKNNADFKGNGYGCHENYLVPLSLWSELAIASCGYLPSIFQLFLAIRPILCGAGYVTPDARFLSSASSARKAKRAGR